MIKIAIVEDEIKYQKQISDYLNEYAKKRDYEFSITIFNNGLDFVEKYSSIYDVAFIDIELPLMNGMDAAKRIRETDKNVEIIFSTRLSNYAVEGYLVEAFDYVLKPLNYNSLEIKLDRLLNKINNKKEKYYIINIKTNEFVKLPHSSILYFESFNHYVSIVTSEGEFQIRDKITNIINALNSKSFAQCGKSYLVNLKHISYICDNNVGMVNGTVLPISRAYNKQFKNIFTTYFTHGGI